MSTRSTARLLRVPRSAARPSGRSCFAGLEILDEHEGEAAMLLWQAVRGVELWGAPGPLPELFAPGAATIRRARLEAAGLDPELREALERVSVILESPCAADAAEVVEACRRAAAWAERSGKPATAVAFAQAAAAADPESASAAVLVGRLARMRAEYGQAEGWLEHAVVLARHSGDWQAYTEAYAGLGNLYVQKGNFPRAKQYHLRCLRQARRRSLHEMAGAAFHNLFALTCEGGRFDEAETFAVQALEAYPRDSRGLPRLAFDLAYRWVDQRRYGPALVLLQECLPSFGSAADRVLVLAAVARAAGGAGDGDAFERAWSEAWAALAEPAGSVSARVFLDLAHGAAERGERERAGRAARRAVEIAGQRGEARVLLEAESVLASMPGGAPAAGEHAGSRDTLTSRFVEALRKQRAAASTT